MIDKNMYYVGVLQNNIHCSGETNPRIGNQRFESFCGRARRFESQNQGFEFLLPGEKHPKLLEIVKNWAFFSKSLREQLPSKNI
jgi:hypothetical protein